MKAKFPKKTNQIRIIGGQHKRRSISFIDAEGLRPTPDRLRETIFNWLMADIQSAHILDVCAGSGVLGFEALSRGAAFATFIEFHKQQASQLKQTAAQLALHNTTIFQGDCLSVIPTLATPFHVVFIDPPYALNLWQPIIDKLIEHKLITHGTQLYVESDKPIEHIINTPITIIKHTKVGQALAYLVSIKSNTMN
ncbi:16S rRNA (guanine(966)-N(2))-methyltransferase RsmD [Moraxella haemolytica]|uniref:16S rRNA (guanine(966)-N(2))-methyltransferase RsmD n=1 Tax=Moraxella TaxID=475 RepID=UPI002543E801|nr:16S rRNA (guanine(966)-N(2))-methyltransferase RsmD [Moraxella sp. ZY171148]WII95850.1 16S rRNA (guanine(966)-N(2))-methyltransferase RsmD [Moraxella sp. ZY171148]